MKFVVHSVQPTKKIVYNVKRAFTTYLLLNTLSLSTIVFFIVSSFFFLLLKGKYWLHLKYCTKVYGILVFCSVILVMFNCCSLSLKSENVVWFMCKIWTCRDYIHCHSGNNVYVTFLTEQGFLWGFCDGELCLFFCI